MVLTGLIAYLLANRGPRWNGIAIILGCGVIGPSVALATALWSPLIRPSPHSIDGPAYVMILLLGLAATLLPLCLFAAFVGVRHAERLRRRRT